MPRKLRKQDSGEEPPNDKASPPSEPLLKDLASGFFDPMHEPAQDKKSLDKDPAVCDFKSSSVCECDGKIIPLSTLTDVAHQEPYQEKKMITSKSRNICDKHKKQLGFNYQDHNATFGLKKDDETVCRNKGIKKSFSMRRADIWMALANSFHQARRFAHIALQSWSVLWGVLWRVT